MKKITILALHLGYGGIERCIANLTNSIKGNYEIENVKCKDYVCTLNDKGKEKTKKCATPSTREIEDPEATLNEEEIDNLVDIDG